MSRLRKTYEGAKNADSAYSLAGWVFKALDWAAPLAVGALMGWASTYRDWIWNDFGLLGALSIGLAGALVAGLTVFLSGLGIAAWRKPVFAPAQNTAPIPKESNASRRPVSGLEVVQRIEQLESERAKTPKQPLKPMLTAYDVEQHLRAIDELYAYLDTKVMPTSGNRERLAGRINQEIIDGTAIVSLEKSADEIREALEGYFRLAERYIYFPEINHTAVEFQWNPQEIIQANMGLRAELIRVMRSFTGTQAAEYMANNKFLADFIAVGNKLWPWINSKKQALAEKRHQYQTAEVYPK